MENGSYWYVVPSLMALAQLVMFIYAMAQIKVTQTFHAQRLDKYEEIIETLRAALAATQQHQTETAAELRGKLVTLEQLYQRVFVKRAI